MIKKKQELKRIVVLAIITTLTCLIVYYLCVMTFINPKNAIGLQIANIIAWLFSVLLEKIISGKPLNRYILLKLPLLFIDMFIMFLLVTVFKMDSVIVKTFIEVSILLLICIFNRIIIFNKKKRVLFISSTGGHLSELLQLKGIFNDYDYSLITERTKSNISLKSKFKNVSFLLYGTKDHIFPYIFKFLYNSFKSIILYFKIRPKVIVTTGTHTAVPMCYIGKLFGSKVIFIETFANRTTRTLSGRIVYPISDTFIVQWIDMLGLYPRAVLGGWIY